MVVDERWPWLKALLIFNAVGVVMSFVAYENMGNELFWLAVPFPVVTMSAAFPLVAIAVLVIALTASSFYAARGVEGTDSWRRFFAALTMSGAVAAVGSTGLCGIILILLVVVRFARRHKRALTRTPGPAPAELGRLP